ncbi:MAG: TolC family protein [Desulfobacteraceae bacterium]|jgi:NodT family efflux transporter outer membrane factor (OMF) lipoprotein
MSTRARARIAAVLCAILLTMGCSASPRDFYSPIDVPDRFSASGTQDRQPRWWKDFGDPALNAAIEEALSSNFSLRTVWDRLAQAEAIARHEGAALFPTLNGEAGAVRTRTQTGKIATYASNLRLEAAAGYEIDLWGRIRSKRQAALLDVQAGELDVQSAAVSLSASVASTWYELAEALAQVRILASQRKTNKQLLDLVTMRFSQGQVQAVDVLQQRQLVQSSEGLLTLAEQRVEALRHQLAVLLGKPPKTDLGKPDPTLILPGPLPQTGLPAEWVQRRPDVKSAYLAVQAQDRRLASAIAARYPRLSLSAGLETSGTKTRFLFDNWLANLAANLVQPVFQGGELRAEVDRNRAVLSQTYHEYGEVLLNALQEVEDTLSREAHQEKYLQSLEKQLKTAAIVIERTRSSYLNGQLDYLRVLEALTSRQSLERELLSAKREHIEYRIQLHRALAGSLLLERPAPLKPTEISSGEHGKPEVALDE